MQNVARSKQYPEKDEHVRQQRDVNALAHAGPRPLVFEVVDEMQQLIGFHALVAGGGFPAKSGTDGRFGWRALRWWNFCNRHALCGGRTRSATWTACQDPALPFGYCLILRPNGSWHPSLTSYVKGFLCNAFP